MKFKNLILIIFLLTSCAKNKVVLICGDHVCINKTEANQYFEENLSIEVKILDKKEKKEFNLVELNLKNNHDGKKNIRVSSKKTTNKNLKVLSKDEISEIKKKISKNKKNNIAKKIDKKRDVIKNEDKINSKKDKLEFKNINKSKNKSDVVDICKIIEKCSIEEISKYLVNEGKKKKFPDLTKR